MHQFNDQDSYFHLNQKKTHADIKPFFFLQICESRLSFWYFYQGVLSVCMINFIQMKQSRLFEKRPHKKRDMIPFIFTYYAYEGLLLTDYN